MISSVYRQCVKHRKLSFQGALKHEHKAGGNALISLLCDVLVLLSPAAALTLECEKPCNKKSGSCWNGLLTKQPLRVSARHVVNILCILGICELRALG